MTSQSPTFLDTTSPASGKTEYFDAPVMIWNKDSSDATVPSNDKFGAFVEHLDYDADDVSRNPPVSIPRDPVVHKPSQGGDGTAEEPHNVTIADGDADKFTSSHRRSDSGYGSTANARSPSRASEGNRSMQPIPILWSESQRARNQSVIDGEAYGEEETTYRDGPSKEESPFKRASSLRSFRSAGPRASNIDTMERRSIRTAPEGEIGRLSSMRRRRISLTGGSFASGAGTVGPASTAMLDDAFHARSRSADLGLTEKQKAKLSKDQIKEGKKVAKIIVAEGKAEKKALNESLNELADLQKLQKNAVKAESKAYAAYSKTLREFHKVELEFFAMRAKYERAQADLQAQEDARDASRSHARETTEMLQEKNREVEWLRAQKAVDDREREVKVRQLTGKA